MKLNWRRYLCCCLVLHLLDGATVVAEEQLKVIQTDLLIVGGTESGCAAALQAARMGVESITLVNDIEWLGGQFSAEALVAIDENRGPEGYGHGVPFPRSGIFREVIDAIESRNVEKYGVPRPGNTRVITTCRPTDAEHVFRQLLQPHVDSGVISIRSHYAPQRVLLNADKTRVLGVRFTSTVAGMPALQVEAKLTIDASDWGDVIRLSGAKYEFGPDLKSAYQEPLAPTSREDYPLTDMNPITYCMVLEETDSDQTIPQPPTFDRRNYDNLPYPSDPSWIYESRRLVDRQHFASINTPDVVLLCFPAFDYPLDVFGKSVAAALEATEPGASRKNIVEMSRQQRQIVFEDAKQRSLGFLYYLQTIAHEKASDPQRTFRNLKLSDEFGTPDQLPFKPYVRESLRLKAQYQLKQQDTTGVGNVASHYATAMFHDPIACWQFEYDFHPTQRKFLDDDPAGAWHPVFRKNRTWGPPYSGRAQFPLRSLVPEMLDGLLGGQKNLGYTSLVSSAVRLHDQSVAIGQGCGAVAAVALQHGVSPRELTWRRDSLAEIWNGLLSAGAVPQTLWPFGDLDPTHAHFVSINQLAVRQLFPLGPAEVEFRADEEAIPMWKQQVLDHMRSRGVDLAVQHSAGKIRTRGEFAAELWARVQTMPEDSIKRVASNDADGDGIVDHLDPLPLTEGVATWQNWSPPPESDGLPDESLLNGDSVRRFNFGGPGKEVAGFVSDFGLPFQEQLGYGWKRSIATNYRERGRYQEVIRDGFLFTRSHDTWEVRVEPGRYAVTVCLGDSGHEQVGQNVTVEGLPLMRNLTTAAGSYLEKTLDVDIKDQRLTVEIGLPGSQTNTCLTWIIFKKLPGK